MARQYVQRLTSVSQLAHWSASKPLLAPSLSYLRPTINAQRLLTFNNAHQQQQQQHQVHSNTNVPHSPSASLFDTGSTTGLQTTSFSGDRRFSQVAALKVPASTNTAAAAAAEGTQQQPATDEPLPSFQFVAHAAWHPKNRHPRQKQTERKLPYWKRNKVGNVDAGEDAFFHTCTPYGMALGVADGVGGWAEAGVDPAIFSWTLMNNAACVAKKSEQQPPIDALQILDTAFHQLQRGGKVAAGSSTACILNLCKTTGKMTSVNLGDSAFLLIRDQKIVYESPSQQHYFNCPYQLTVVPDTYPDRDTFVTDMPKDADQKSFFLKDNDIILLATDGYFDNVYPHETLSTINETMKTLLDQPAPADDETVATVVRSLAKALTDKARLFSLDPKRLSPWAKEAQAHGSNYRGGKVDDITCVVTFVRGIQRLNEQQQQ